MPNFQWALLANRDVGVAQVTTTTTTAAYLLKAFDQ